MEHPAECPADLEDRLRLCSKDVYEKATAMVAAGKARSAWGACGIFAEQDDIRSQQAYYHYYLRRRKELLSKLDNDEKPNEINSKKYWRGVIRRVEKIEDLISSAECDLPDELIRSLHEVFTRCWESYSKIPRLNQCQISKKE